MSTEVMTFKAHVTENVEKVIVGKEREIELMMTAFLAGGHLLLEDMPGMGKTMLVRAFSKSVALPFKRIQFTPDLLPSDVTGIQYYNQKEGAFVFREGPLFANVVLTDEINRATPRTQSALLEAMEESQITADGETRMLRKPFMVMATQNPVESYGTFPLPEAQLDRFMMRFKLGLPTLSEEKDIVLRQNQNPMAAVQSRYDTQTLMALIESVKSVHISEACLTYLLGVVEATRKDKEVRLKVSPRGSIALFKASQAKAALSGRDFIVPEDIQWLAPYVLNHRMQINGVTGVEETTAYVEALVKTVPVPLEAQ
ncbi:AAA family ATPase [Fusibacter sp. JL298sf-3]